MEKEFKLQILLAVFVAMLILSNLLGAKITTFFGVSVSAGIIMAPFMFLVTDIVSEVEGKKVANQFIKIGLGILLVTLLLTLVCLMLPDSPRFTLASDYENIFGLSVRFVVASMVAFGLAQFNDVLAFHHLKRVSKNKYLWLRNNASTAISQMIDTLVFMFIAFYGVVGFSVAFILELSLTYYLFKLLLALIDTPFVYLGVRWLRK